MISQYFYLPANQKATEEECVRYTQERLAEVDAWLRHDFVREHPGSYSYATLEGKIVGWKIIVTPDRRICINRNWWNMAVDWFCQEHRCKLEETDLLYRLMLLYRLQGFDVKPVDGSLCITLFVPQNLTR